MTENNIDPSEADNEFTRAFDKEAAKAPDDAADTTTWDANAEDAAERTAMLAADLSRHEAGPQAVTLLGTVFELPAYKVGDCDAIFIGDATQAVKEHRTVVAQGYKRSSRRWHNVEGTMWDLVSRCSDFTRSDDKDGWAITNGPLTTPERLKTSVSYQTIACFDDDSGLGIWAIAEAIHKCGWAAICYSTHSHAKTKTTVHEIALMRWLRAKGAAPGHPADLTDEHVRKYLIERKEIRADLVAGAKIIERRQYAVDQKTGAIKYNLIVEHRPIPRTRVIVFLDRPHGFGDTHEMREAAYTYWKGLYGGVIARTKIPFDQSCASIERLNYLPNIPCNARVSQALNEVAAAGAYQIIILAGDLVRTAEIECVATFSSSINDRVYTGRRERTTKAGAPRVGFKTPFLEEAVRAAGQSLRVLDLLKAVYGNHIVKSKHAHCDGANICCPNGEEHSDFDDPTDPDNKNKNQGSMAINGDPKADQWPVIYCPHAGCSDEAADENGNQNWRFFLDVALQHAERDASAIFDYCGERGPQLKKSWDEWQAEKKVAGDALRAWDEAVKLGSDVEELNAAIARFAGRNNDNISDADCEPIWRALGTRGDARDTQRLTDKFAQATGTNKPTAKRTVAARRAEYEKARVNAETEGQSFNDWSKKTAPDDDGVVFGHTAPKTAPKNPKCVRGEWDHAEQVRVATALFEVQNRHNVNQSIAQDGHQPPTRIFRCPEADIQYVQLVRGEDGRYCTRKMTNDAWTAVLAPMVEYRKTTEKEGDRGRPIPEPVIAAIRGSVKLDVPVLQAVIGVPVFSAKGSLRTESGYDSDTGFFLVPDFELRPKPEVIEHGHVEEAQSILIDGALRDFGFSDEFGGNEAKPFYTEERDADGYKLPDLTRGAGSRANMLALVLHSFVVYMIHGPKPSYHIDKASPGEGAGKLTNVVGFIRDGKRMTARTLPKKEEDIKKEIVSARRSGATALLWDNQNHKVDSETLASYETSEEFAARILGISQDIYMGTDVPMIFTGNNSEFANEAYRRKVPIRLDAGAADPTKRRVKYDPLEEWLQANRRDLVWAVHVLIGWWVQRGMPKPQHCSTFASFTEYTNVLGGVLETAGIPGFLSNRDDYMATKNSDASGCEVAILRMRDEFPDGRRFTARELYDKYRVAGLDGSYRFADSYISLTKFGEPEQVQELGGIVAKMEGKTVRDNRGRFLKLVLSAKVSPKQWHVIEVSDAVANVDPG